MKTNLRKMILWTIALLAISIMTTSSVNPGYNEFGNDINECLEDPCPEGYTCMNLPGSFLWEAPDGEIIEGDGDSSSKGYKVHDGDCSFSASIDADVSMQREYIKKHFMESEEIVNWMALFYVNLTLVQNFG